MIDRIIMIIAAIVIIVLAIILLTGCSTLGEDQAGFVYQDGDGNVCSLWILKPYGGDINPYNHYLQNKDLYVTIWTGLWGKCPGAWGNKGK